MAFTVADGLLDVDDTGWQESVDASYAGLYGQEIVDTTRAEGFRLVLSPDYETLRAALDLPNGDVLPVGMTTNFHRDDMAKSWRKTLQWAKERTIA